MRRKLSRSFYARPAPILARALLGKVLVHRAGGRLFSGMIVETESYHGRNDKASHASRGRTQRTAVMFDTVGHAYVYFTYGMHWLCNVTCGKIGFPSTALIRALEPIRVPRGVKTNGPARLTKALRITGKQNRIDLAGSELWIENRGVRIPARSIARAKRIGVEYAGSWKEKPWRFFVKGNLYVSRK